MFGGDIGLHQQFDPELGRYRASWLLLESSEVGVPNTGAQVTQQFVQFVGHFVRSHTQTQQALTYMCCTQSRSITSALEIVSSLRKDCVAKLESNLHHNWCRPEAHRNRSSKLTMFHHRTSWLLSKAFLNGSRSLSIGSSALSGLETSNKPILFFDGHGSALCASIFVLSKQRPNVRLHAPGVSIEPTLAC